MNQITTQKSEGTGLSYKNIGIAQAGGGGMLLPQTFGEVVAFATMMARSQHAIPNHLRENEGACMAVAMQALRWEMDPFAVAAKSYNVKDLIAYEAQLIMAVVNTRSGIDGRLKYSFEGEGPDRVCICTGKLDGEVLEVRSPKFKDIHPKNSPLWKSDPDQQHCYYTGRAWARRFTPEVILGVYDREEAEQFRGPENARDVTPAKPTVMDRLQQARSAAQEPASAREGFCPSFTRDADDFTSDDLTGGIIEPGAADLPASEGGVDDLPAPQEAGGDAAPSSSPASTDIRPQDLEWLQSAARMLVAATGFRTGDDGRRTLDAQRTVVSDSLPKPEGFPARASAKAEAVVRRCREIVAGDLPLDEGLEIIAGTVGCEVADLKKGRA